MKTRNTSSIIIISRLLSRLSLKADKQKGEIFLTLQSSPEVAVLLA